MGLLYVASSTVCRSQDPALADCYVIVDQSFGTRGVGTFFCRLWNRLSYELGYKACFSDTFLTNVAVLKIMRKCRFLLMGTVWRGGHLKGKGYTDTVTFYRETFKGDPQQCALSSL